MRKIAATDLAIGMFVINTGLSWMENPFLYSVEGEIRSQAQIEAILKEGFSEVFVDPARGEQGRAMDESLSLAARLTLDPSAVGDVGYEPRRNPVAYEQEIGVAKTLYDDSLRLAKDFVKAVRNGLVIDFEKSETFVENMVESVVRNADALVSLTKLRAFDEYTFTHCINVAVLSLAFGKYLALPRATLHALGVAGLFHDLGKALIPAEILNKPGKLTDEEFTVIRGHPMKGYQSLANQMAVADDILRAIVEHHEKYNGKGYPRGLSGEAIHALARIISLADVYDALTSERVYKRGMLPSKALSVMYGMRDQDFFPELADSFIKCLGIYPVGSFVRLTSGEYALVAASNPASPLRPTVKLVLDQEGRLRPPATINLAGNGAPAADPCLRIAECLDPLLFNLDPAQFLL